MKSVSPALLTLFASRQFFSANLFTFTLSGGLVLRYTDGDANLISGGNTFSAGGQSGAIFNDASTNLKISWKLGLAVDTLQFNVICRSELIGGVPFLEAIKMGMFDGADVLVEKAFMPSYGDTSSGTIILFSGKMGEIDAGRSQATFSVNSDLEILNRNFPRNLFQASCGNTLFDANCALNRASFAVAGTVLGGSTANTVNATLAQASGYFTLGSLSFSSGANAGFSRTVKLYTHGSPSVMSLISPFPNAPAIGDTFNVFPGCDKTQSTCAGKFSNLANFRGMPYVPEASTSI